MRALALAALLTLAVCPLAGCHHPQADQPTPGGDGEAQANTAAKTIADLKAADDAAQGPAPEIAPARAPREEKVKVEPDTPEPADTNDDDTVETNAN
ncbi:hypothetical protein FHS31_000045 [Sphingomonas vulcanisoli]|uniref:Secreted protein n=1 Tax=Sphingomonas vulcanisoli TaxID=1658060 RepID=A0ABX0TLR0_9SPHN|nr:hypothetical protein [Sphingomonas vulcanisoli]NIJ06463.1 hypothetical protein [Sphingomonas vulcanisoli]